jgi:hypothetical protein
MMDSRWETLDRHEIRKLRNQEMVVGVRVDMGIDEIHHLHLPFRGWPFPFLDRNRALV